MGFWFNLHWREGKMMRSSLVFLFHQCSLFLLLTGTLGFCNELESGHLEVFLLRLERFLRMERSWESREFDLKLTWLAFTGCWCEQWGFKCLTWVRSMRSLFVLLAPLFLDENSMFGAQLGIADYVLVEDPKDKPYPSSLFVSSYEFSQYQDAAVRHDTFMWTMFLAVGISLTRIILVCEGWSVVINELSFVLSCCLVLLFQSWKEMIILVVIAGETSPLSVSFVKAL